MNKVRYLFVLFFITLSIASFGQSLKCSYCERQIERTYISFNGNYYHEDCYKNFIQPRCVVCRKQIDGEFIIHENKKYHEECYNKNVALRCSLCEEIINGTYTSDFWGNKYHSSHENCEARCDYCDRFISADLTRGGSKYSDGRVICSLCERNSVKSITKAESIFNTVRNSIKEFGIKINHDRISLKLVDRNTLQSISQSKGGITDTRGFAEYTYWQTDGRIERKQFTVYILSGMPQKEFEAVAAHELMHVWQYLNSSSELDPKLREGSAEYIAFMYLNKYLNEESKFLIHKISNNRNEIYGEGFRTVKRIVERNGFNYLLNYLQK